MKYSRDKEFHRYVKILLSEHPPNWQVIASGKHLKLLHTPTGRKVPIPFSPSDRRGFFNFKAQIRKIHD
ncbi:hypothetical protein CRG49_002165 [Neisseria sp. N95_16]|nr:hypothetical protein CRG49_002165 [Neisseria sp. N95_16]